MLTEAQLFQSHTFGFLIFRQLFRPDEVETLRREFRQAMEARYRHAPFDGTRRHWLPMMGAETPFFAGLLEDPRFCETAEQLYGEDALAIISDANRYVGDTGWHPDTGSLDQYGVKFAYYLQPVGAESGALRVIPGSHRDPLHADLRQKLGRSRLSFREVPAYACEAEPGDVIAFDLRLWHGSCGGSGDRRMGTVVYYHNPSTPEETEATRRQAEMNPRYAADFDRPVAPIYLPEWLANPDASPRRQRWIARLQELGFF